MIQIDSMGERTVNGSSTRRLEEDVYAIDFDGLTASLDAKFVFSGWRFKEEKILYGHLLLYQSGTQINGLPLVFFPEGTVRDDDGRWRFPGSGPKRL